MKRTMRTSRAILPLSLVAAGCLAAGIALAVPDTAAATAETELSNASFYIEGASVRLAEDGRNGIRFHVFMSEEKFEALSDEETGVLIQPADGSTPYIIAEYGTEDDTPYKEELSGFKQYLGAVKGMITGDPGYRTVKDDLANASDTDNGMPARRAEDDAEPVSMEPSEPASRIRTATISNLFAGAGGNQGGTLFWYEGAWYDVRQLDRNGEIYRAFLEYSRRQGNADR